MADPETAEFQRRALTVLSALLLIAGLSVYWAWGLLYDTWYPFNSGNIGIYTVYVPLIVFGILGLLLTRKPVLKGD
ncbi:MAG: hypothetical protein QXJ32_06025 [Thermoplasmata archaeon]